MTLAEEKIELKKQFIGEDIEQDITTIVLTKDYTYLEAILEYCEEKNIDVRDMHTILPKSIKDHLELECIKNGLVKGKVPIPIDDNLG